jgi:hypothetical protein
VTTGLHVAAVGGVEAHLVRQGPLGCTAYFAPARQLGGVVLGCLLAPALADAGAEVTVAAPAPAGDSRCGFHRTRVPGTKYRARFSADLDELVAHVRSERPDVVVANQIEEAPEGKHLPFRGITTAPRKCA